MEWTGLLALLALGALLYWLIVVVHIARTLRRPPRRTYATAIARGLPGTPAELPRPLEFREASFRWRRFEAPMWDIETGHRGPVVILTHGWASSRIGMLRRIPHLAPLAGRIIAWDLPGHGEAPGTCSLGPREAEMLAALVSQTREHDDRPLVLYGSSLGAGVSIACAAAALPHVPDIALVIAEAPYRLPQTPAAAVLRERGVPPLGRLRPALALAALASGGDPMWRGFDRAQRAAKVHCPLLVVHGSVDAICPLADGEAIARAAPAGRLAVIEGAGHNDLWSEANVGSVMEAVRAAIEGLDDAAAGEAAGKRTAEREAARD